MKFDATNENLIREIRETYKLKRVTDALNVANHCHDNRITEITQDLVDAVVGYWAASRKLKQVTFARQVAQNPAAYEASDQEIAETEYFDSLRD